MGLRAKENIHIGKIIMFFYFGRMSLNVLIEPFFLFKTRFIDTTADANKSIFCLSWTTMNNRCLTVESSSTGEMIKYF